VFGFEDTGMISCRATWGPEMCGVKLAHSRVYDKSIRKHGRLDRYPCFFFRNEQTDKSRTHTPARNCVERRAD
jgi:hypothetical protein